MSTTWTETPGFNSATAADSDGVPNDPDSAYIYLRTQPADQSMPDFLALHRQDRNTFARPGLPRTTPLPSPYVCPPSLPSPALWLPAGPSMSPGLWLCRLRHWGRGGCGELEGLGDRDASNRISWVRTTFSSEGTISGHRCKKQASRIGRVGVKLK